jgi:hypothetical protein
MFFPNFQGVQVVGQRGEGEPHPRLRRRRRERRALRRPLQPGADPTISL